MMDIGRIVLKARHEREMGQDTLALKAGISRTMLSYIETGRRTPSIEMLEKIAAALEYKLNISFEEMRSTITEVDLKGIFG
jgi:transcriptional regulator with XRE-family HTH domain